MIKSLVFSVISLVSFFSVCFTTFQLAEVLSSQIPWQIIRPGIYVNFQCSTVFHYNTQTKNGSV